MHGRTSIGSIPGFDLAIVVSLVVRLYCVVALVSASPVLAQSPVVIDNGAPQFSTTGTWPTSTAVAGFQGPNYQVHEANGSPPGAIVVDNTSAGFSVTGNWPASTSVSGYLGTNYRTHEANGAPPSALLADNNAGTPVGSWPASTAVSGYLGTNYQTRAAGTGANTFTWTLAVPASGAYAVYARWTQHPNRATNAPYSVNHASGTAVVTVNQQANGGTWQPLGTYSFNAGSTTITLTDQANGYVIADAVMLLPPGAAPNTATWRVNVPASGTYDVYARWTQHPNRATNAPYAVSHASGTTQVPLNQQQGGGTWNLLGTFNFNAGTATINLTDQANGYVIADAVMLLPPGAAPNSATWTPGVTGQYEVYARWTAHTNRATNATYTVTHAQGSTPVSVNQQANGGQWNLLGTFNLTNASTVNLTDIANGYVIADAIQLIPTGPAPQQIYFIHTDHLNTPRLISDTQGQTVWTWNNDDPFGGNAPNENPSGLGAFTCNLRLPGQYFDKETNLHYNYHRWYDPAIGRYPQSDPIGLAGGINTYSYVSANPLGQSDPTGLAAWLCLRSTSFGIGNHAYFYDDKTKQCCGDPGPSGKNPLQSCREKGTSGDSCVLISSSEDEAQKLLKCCNDRTNKSFYFPGLNDCQNLADDCIRQLQMAPSATPGFNRWRPCPSCWRQ